ncbi:family 43 glycosylhydrolase [Bounagaea algeriensis]
MTGESNATYHNAGETPGADPFVLHDPASGYYYAYSTEGVDPGHHFAIHRSPDMVTWQRLPGGALPGEAQRWGRDWFWAPEVYHNPATGKYFLFYSARLRSDLAAEHFGCADFEEPSKLGAAAADSPVGPFRPLGDGPLDYHPYDPEYHDVNLIMDEPERKPPETLQEGRTAPLGTYIPTIDPNLLFDDGRIYLFFSRNAYRNWVWDRVLDKYVEEASIYAVELDPAFWNDPSATTAPRIAEAYRDANGAPGDPARKDGFTPIIDYGSDEQGWENAHVHDYDDSGGEKKDRRWEEGPTALKACTREGRALYFLTYSANSYAGPHYGVGYAVAEHPLGPWRKAPENPVLHTDADAGVFSTGHGSVSASPDGEELFYVHHGRPSVESDRRLYTERMSLDPDRARLAIHQSTADEPLPSGVAPFALRADTDVVEPGAGGATAGVEVTAAPGTAMPLEHPANRVLAEVSPADVARVEVRGDRVVVHGLRPAAAELTLRYQRRRADGRFVDVINRASDAPGGRGRCRPPCGSTTGADPVVAYHYHS